MRWLRLIVEAVLAIVGLLAVGAMAIIVMMPG